MVLPTIQARFAARVLYALHQTWAAIWPLNAGKYSCRHLIHLAARIGLFPPCWTKVEQGWMLLNPTDYVQGSILVYGEWEPETVAIIREKLHPGDCFIDIGANVGYFSLLAASIVGPSGHVLAFEPNPVVRELLLTNIARSEYRNIDVHGTCCSDTPGTVSLYLNDSNNTGACSLSNRNAGTNSAVAVEAVLADSVIRTLPKPPTIIKIDVEGAEAMVLRGMTDTLAHGPTVILELDERLLRGMGSSSREVENSLFGFSLFTNGTTCVAEPTIPLPRSHSHTRGR